MRYETGQRDTAKAAANGDGIMYEADEFKAPYANSTDAYLAIHGSLAFAVDGHLEDCDYGAAMKAAALMREIEEHTDV